MNDTDFAQIANQQKGWETKLQLCKILNINPMQLEEIGYNDVQEYIRAHNRISKRQSRETKKWQHKR